MLAELPWIYFEAPTDRVLARYGDLKLPAPVYDLEAARQTIDLVKLPQAKFADGGALRTTAPATAASDPAAIAPGPLSIPLHSITFAPSTPPLREARR